MSNRDTKILAERIMQIIPRVMRTLAAELRTKGELLTPAHFGVLVMLHFRSTNLSELAAYQGVSLPTMSSTVTNLVERGWVKRVRSKDDRRVVIVELAEAGRQKLAAINEHAVASLVPLLECVTPAEREALGDGLQVLSRVFELTDLIVDNEAT